MQQDIVDSVRSASDNHKDRKKWTKFNKTQEMYLGLGLQASNLCGVSELVDGYWSAKYGMAGEGLYDIKL